MKKTITPVTLRAGIATALCVSIIAYPQLRVSSAGAASAGAATRTAADLKTESQVRSEASRYDGAIRAISGIAKMKLDNADDLKKAFAILEPERANLKFHFSKLVVLAISDSTYAGAIKKKIPDKQAAEAFAKELEADLKAVLKLDGAGSLKTRMERSAEADAAVLRRAGERLKLAGEKIKKAVQQAVAPDFGGSSELKVVRACFSVPSEPVTATSSMVFGPLIVMALSYGAGLMIPSFFVGLHVFLNLFTERGQAAVAECHEKEDANLSSCVSAANELPAGLPFFIRETASALCYTTWLLNSALCLLA